MKYNLDRYYRVMVSTLVGAYFSSNAFAGTYSIDSVTIVPLSQQPFYLSTTGNDINFGINEQTYSRVILNSMLDDTGVLSVHPTFAYVLKYHSDGPNDTPAVGSVSIQVKVKSGVYHSLIGSAYAPLPYGTVLQNIYLDIYQDSYFDYYNDYHVNRYFNILVSKGSGFPTQSYDNAQWKINSDSAPMGTWIGPDSSGNYYQSITWIKYMQYQRKYQFYGSAYVNLVDKIKGQAVFRITHICGQRVNADF